MPRSGVGEGLTRWRGSHAFPSRSIICSPGCTLVNLQQSQQAASADLSIQSGPLFSAFPKGAIEASSIPGGQGSLKDDGMGLSGALPVPHLFSPLPRTHAGHSSKCCPSGPILICTGRWAPEWQDPHGAWPSSCQVGVGAQGRQGL